MPVLLQLCRQPSCLFLLCFAYGGDGGERGPGSGMRQHDGWGIGGPLGEEMRGKGGAQATLRMNAYSLRRKKTKAA